MKLACSIRARFPWSIQLQIVQRRVGEDIPGALTGAFLSVVATTITLKTRIDARGLPGNTTTSMTCTASPWAGIANPPPSTILLPAVL